MALLSVGILLSISLLFFTSVRWLILPKILKKNPEMQIISFSWIVGTVFLTSLLIAGYALSVFNVTIINPSFFMIMALGGLAFVVMPFLVTKNTKLQILALFLFCLAGTFVIPAPNPDFILTNTLFRFAGALFWCAIILTSVVLDRIPLFSYITNTSAFVVLSLACTSFAGILPYSFFHLFILIILLNLLTFCIFKKTGILVYTFPIVFLLNWITGYILLHFMFSLQAIYIPLFYSFAIMEIAVAVSINFYKNRRFLPISVPFATEHSFTLNIPLKKIVKKLFYTNFIVMFVAIVAIKVSHDNSTSILYVYFIAVIVLYNTYRILCGQSQGTSLWAAIKDVKTGLGVLKEEISKSVSQKLGSSTENIQKSNKSEADGKNDSHAPEKDTNNNNDDEKK